MIITIIIVLILLVYRISLGTDTVLNSLNIAILTAETLKKNTPTLEDEVTVEVVGQPGITKQQLYFLALSAASATARQIAPLSPLIVFVQPSAGMLMIEYDAADNWVRCTLKYQSGMAANYAIALADSTPGTIFDRLVVYRGPSCVLNGAPFGFTALTNKSILKAVGIDGILANVIDVGLSAVNLPALANTIGTKGLLTDGDRRAPNLPFAGQPILTPCPATPVPAPRPITQSPVPFIATTAVGSIASPNPKPPGDNRSRGAVLIPGSPSAAGTGDACCNQSLALVPLVFAALSAPGTNTLQTFPDPTASTTALPGG